MVTPGLWVLGVLWSSWFGFGLQPHTGAALFAPGPHVHTQGTGETNVQEHIVVAVWKQVTAGTCRFAGRSQDFPSLEQLVPCWITGLEKVEISLK